MFVCERIIYIHYYLDYCSVAIAVLKKHYHALWRSFPDDHMITLATLCGEFKIHDEAIEMVSTCSTSEGGNRTILDYIIFITNGEQQMNAFCDLMAKLINNPKLSRVVSSLRKGTYKHYVHSFVVCMCTAKQVCMYAYIKIKLFTMLFRHVTCNHKNPYYVCVN